MDIKTSVISTFKVSSTGLPVYRVQFLDADDNVIGDVDIATAADCVDYINDNPIIKDALGFKKGTVIDTDIKDIIDRILYPYYPPEVLSIENVAALPELEDKITQDTVVYKEKGIILPRFKMAVTVMSGSKTLVRCSLIRVLNNKTETIETKALSLSNGNTQTIDFTLPGLNDDTQYYFEVSDNEKVISSPKIDFKFILPIYVGYAKDGLLDPALKIEDLNQYLNALILQKDRVEKRLVEINSEQKAFFDIVPDKDLLCPFILVPLKWNSLIKVEDINGMDITKFFKRNNRIVLRTSEGNTDNEGYKLYISRKPADSKAKTRYLRDIKYTFAYDFDWKDIASEGEQTEVLTGFDVLTNGPIDSRFVVDTYSDLSCIPKPYEGLVVYVKSTGTFYKYNAYNVWEVTNNMTRFYSGMPSQTMGGILDISIDIATGDIYQKNNSNIWELKGNIRTGEVK